MDSVTQLALGAAVGYATLGPRVGRRALVWGAALGTLPDLDVLLPLEDPVASFTGHRSWSHSLLVLGMVSPLAAWSAVKLHPGTREHFRGWWTLAGLVLLTHVLLDCFTVYGTQIFWPLERPPESWSTVFVVDPAYTLPLLVGCVTAWFRHRDRPRSALRWNTVGLALSTLYLAWTVAAKAQVEAAVTGSLARQGVESHRILTTPTPLNSLLWRIVVLREGGYLEGFHSLVADDASDDIDWTEHTFDPELRQGVRGIPAVERLDWFTHGFWSVQRRDGRAVVTDLRMGSEPDYVFAFAVARVEGAADPEPIEPERIETTLDWTRLRGTAARIFSSARPGGR